MLNKLVANGVTYDDSHIYGGVTFSQNVNPSVDIQYGVVAIAEITFTLDTRLTLNTQVAWHCAMMGMVDEDDEPIFDQMGIFYVNSVEKKPNGKYTHKCYDIINNLDIDCTLWFKRWLCVKWNGGTNTSFNLNGNNGLIKAIETKFLDGVEIPAPDPTPSHYTASINISAFLYGNDWIDAPLVVGVTLVPTDIKMSKVTVRQLFSQICVYLGLFAEANPYGNIQFRSFSKIKTGASTYVLPRIRATDQKEKTTLLADYDAPKVNVVSYTYKGNYFYYSDEEVEDGDIENEYVVPDNWFLNRTGGETPLRPELFEAMLGNIYDMVHQLPNVSGEMYRPVSLRTFTDFGYTGSAYYRLVAGDIFEYEGDTITATESQVSTAQLPYQDPTRHIYAASSFEFLPNNKYRLGGNFIDSTLSQLRNTIFYTISDSPIDDYYNANQAEGTYLYKVDYKPTDVAFVTVYRIISTSRDKHLGIVMRKKITPQGVEIQCTGGEYRQDTRVQGDTQV